MPVAVLGPEFVKVTVPDTGWPAFTFAGNATAAARSATGFPAIVTVTLLLPGFGSTVVVLTAAVTVEVPEEGWVYLMVIGPTLAPAARVVGMPVSVTTPLLAL